MQYLTESLTGYSNTYLALKISFHGEPSGHVRLVKDLFYTTSNKELKKEARVTVAYMDASSLGLICSWIAVC